MNLSGVIFAAFAASACLSPAATLIFEDNFDVNTAGWYKGGSDGTLSNLAGTLSWNPITAPATAVIARQFSATTLTVGQTLRLSYSWTPQNDGSLISRVALLNVANPISADNWNSASGIGGNASGYFSFYRDDSATGNGARYETGSVNSSTDLDSGTVIGSNTSSYNFTNGTVYTVVFDVTLTSLSQVQTHLTVSSLAGTHMTVDGSHSGVDIVSSFNTVGLRVQENTTSRYDNVRLEVIPEPSAALLAAVGSLAFAASRRRKS